MTIEPGEETARERWKIIATAFDTLAEVTPAERAKRLGEIEAKDPALAVELRSLLAGLEAEGSLFERPVFDLGADGDGPDGEASVPDRIGPYRVLERLGQGGMGTVYRAVREDGALDQVVAIKVVVAADADPNRLERFAREARLLSRLDHPGIARPLDAGRLDERTAYLVMEYVDGVRIDRYCDEARLPPGARLGLVARLCAAVQFAHRNLVVHRDIKPANVLVDQDGKPRLLDFGIARLLESGEEQRELTLTGHYALTPQYASPEQFTGEPITTASDVYALGALAYGLLCGRPPVDLSDLSLTEMVARVCRETPPAPSATSGDPSLRGDVDAIVMTALRKEPERRYGSAGELAADLERYLAGEPVRAHADSLAYRAGKFLRRHRLAVAASAIGALALAALAVVATVQAIQAEEARARAELEAGRVRSVLTFFQEMLASADPARAQGTEPTVRELLDRTAERLGDSVLDPVALATVRETVGSTYLALGLSGPALPQVEGASALLTTALGPEHPRTLAARHAEARVHLYNGAYERAIEILEPTYEARRRLLGDAMDTMSSLHNLAFAYAGLGEVERALELDLVQLEIVERLSGPGSPESLTTLSSVAHGYYSLGRLEEAREIFARIHAGQRDHLGDRHPTTLSALHNLAALSRQTGDVAGAEARYREVIALRRAVLGDRHAQTLNSLSNLGELLLGEDRFEEAEMLIVEALTGRRAALGDAHPDTVDSLIVLARLRLAQGREAEGRAAAQEALTIAQERLPDGSPAVERAAAAVAELGSDRRP